jgi:hypothetical protein
MAQVLSFAVFGLVTFIIANTKALFLFAEQTPLNLCGFQCAFSMRSMSSLSCEISRMPEADGCRMENDVRAKSPEAGAGLPAGGERGVDPIPSIWSILKESACDK